MKFLFALLLLLPAAAAEFTPKVVNTMAELRELQPIPSQPLVQVLGYYAAGDGGGGDYVLTNSITGTNAYGGRILALGGAKGWQLSEWSGDLRQFGVVMDSEAEAANNNARWAAAVAFAANYFPEEWIVIPKGELIVATTVDTGNHKSFRGASQISPALSRIYCLDDAATVFTISTQFGRYYDFQVRHDFSDPRATNGTGFALGSITYVQGAMFSGVSAAFCGTGFDLPVHFDLEFINCQARPCTDVGLKFGASTQSKVTSFRAETAWPVVDATVTGDAFSNTVGVGSGIGSKFRTNDFVSFTVVQRPRRVVGISGDTLTLDMPLHRSVTGSVIRIQRPAVAAISCAGNVIGLGYGNLFGMINAEWGAWQTIIQYSSEPYYGSSLEGLHVEGWSPVHPSGGSNGDGQNWASIFSGSLRSKMVVEQADVINSTFDGTQVDGVEIINGNGSLEMDSWAAYEIDRNTNSSGVYLRASRFIPPQHASDVVIHRARNRVNTIWQDGPATGSLRQQRGIWKVGEFIAQDYLGSRFSTATLPRIQRYGQNLTFQSGVWINGDRLVNAYNDGTYLVPEWIVTTAGNDLITPAGNVWFRSGKPYFSGDASAFATMAIGLPVTTSRRAVTALPLTGWMSRTNAISATLSAGSLRIAMVNPSGSGYQKGDWLVVNPGAATEELVMAQAIVDGTNITISKPLVFDHIPGELCFNVGLLEANAPSDYDGAFNSTQSPSGAVAFATTMGPQSVSATLDFPSTASGSYSDLTVSVIGAAGGSRVVLGLPATPAAGIVWNAWVSATDTVTIRANNPTGSPIDPGSASYGVTVIR